MTAEAALLNELIAEVKGLRADVRATNLTTCNADQAIEILGRKNKRDLTFFWKKGLLDRSGSANTGYTYYKPQLLALVEKIRTGEVQLPKR